MYTIHANGELLYFPPLPETQVVEPKLSMETGKAGSLEFSLPPLNPFHDAVLNLKTIVTVERDTVEIFRGRVLTSGRDIDTIRKVYCEGILAYLVDSKQKPEAFRGYTHDLFIKIINGHNAQVETEKQFKIGLITIENREIIITGTSESTVKDTGKFDYKQIEINSITEEWQATFDYIAQCLVEYCGGYLRVRHESDGNYIDYISSYGSTTSQSIEYGVNIVEYNDSITAEELFTVLIPLGDENLTISSVNGGSPYLFDNDAVATYGRIFMAHTFEGVTDPATLLENAQRYLASKVNVPKTIAVTAVDLSLIDQTIEPISLGDSLLIKSKPHGVSEVLPCNRFEIPLDAPEAAAYTFGTSPQSLTERYKKNKKKKKGGGGGKASEEFDGELDMTFVPRFNAWCTKNPEYGYIDIGALSETSRDYDKTRQVLLTEVGIDLDGVTGNVNIKSTQTLVQDLDNDLKTANEELSRHEAQLSLLQIPGGVTIDLSALASKADTSALHVANLQITATEQASIISAIAETVELKAAKDLVDQQGTMLASVTASVNSMVAQVALKAEQTALDGLGTNVAQIIARADGIDSTLLLQADKIELKANKTYVDNLIAEQITALQGDIGWLTSKWIICSNVSVTGGIYIAGGTAATQEWVQSRGYETHLAPHKHVTVGANGYTGPAILT